MNYAEISALVDAGKTPQEIADALNANPLHHRNTYITGGPADTSSLHVLHLLTVRFQVMRQNSRQEWIGPLVDLADASPQVAAILELLYPQLQVKDSIVYCGESPDSANMVNGLVSVVGSIVQSPWTAQDVVDAVAVLTGGRRYGSVTVDQVQACIDAHTAVSEQNAIESRRINAAALAAERIMAVQSDAERAAVWAKAWEDAV